MAAEYFLAFTNVPFVSDIAKTVPMRFSKGGVEPSPSSQEPPKDQQPEPDLIDELNRLISTKLSNEVNNSGGATAV